MRDPANENDPFERLIHTHRRIEQRLEDLAYAVADASEPERRDEALRVVGDVLGFFERAGARHHQDEEASLFPRLRGVPELAAILTALEQEHRAHDAAQIDLTAIVRRVEGGATDASTLDAFRDAAVRLATVYRNHIAREERELFPAARAALDAATREAMAQEMSGRRRG